MKEIDLLYPLATSAVDGRHVRERVPNTSSIESSLNDYEILPGIREVKFTLFDQMTPLVFHSASEESRTRALADSIRESSEINPLIVVIDDVGPYILEGGHRFDALRILGATAFPAKVVLDLESINQDLLQDMSADNKDAVVEIEANKFLSGAVEMPFAEGVPNENKVKDMASWLKKNSERYKTKYTVLYHGTCPSLPILEDGLKPTSAGRRRSFQSTSGYVYLANTPERAEQFGRMGNGGRCTVYAVRVLVRSLRPDLDQLRNQRSVGTEVGNSLAESIIYGGGARVKGAIHHADLIALAKNSKGEYMIAKNEMSDAERHERNERNHQEQLDSTGFWGKEAAGCIFLAASTGRIMLAHRSEDVLEPDTHGTWGGAIDEGETPEECVRREVEQEAGRIENCRMYPLAVFEKSNFKYHNFLAVVDDEFTPTLNWESQGFSWCETNDLPTPLHPGMNFLFANSKDEIERIRESAMSSYKSELALSRGGAALQEISLDEHSALENKSKKQRMTRKP